MDVIGREKISDLGLVGKAHLWLRATEYRIDEEGFVAPAPGRRFAEYDPAQRDADGAQGGDLLREVYTLGKTWEQQYQAGGQFDPELYLTFARRYGLFSGAVGHRETPQSMGQTAYAVARLMDAGREGHRPDPEDAWWTEDPELKQRWADVLAEPPIAYPVGVTLVPDRDGWRLGFVFPTLEQAVRLFWIQSQTTHDAQICERCGRIFFAVHGGHERRYCSDTCKNTAKKARYRAKKAEEETQKRAVKAKRGGKKQ